MTRSLYLVCTRMPGDSYPRRFMFQLLCPLLVRVTSVELTQNAMQLMHNTKPQIHQRNRLDSRHNSHPKTCHHPHSVSLLQTVKVRERVIVRQTNTGAVPRATFKKRPDRRVECNGLSRAPIYRLWTELNK